MKLHPDHSLWIAAAQAGDENAWRLLLKQWHWLMAKAVYKARRRGCDLDDAWSVARYILFVCVRKWDANREVSFMSYLHPSLMLGVPSNALRIKHLILIPRRHYGKKLAPIMVSLSACNTERQNHKIEMEDPYDYFDTSMADYDAIMRKLTAPERHIIEQRLGGVTCKELSAKMGVSGEVVRLTEKRIMNRLRKIFVKD